MKLVPVIRFRPSGPDMELFAPTHVGPVLQPANPPVICFRNVLVLTSITSTDLLLRSVKYIRSLTGSTALMSNEKFVPVVTLGTPITFTKPGLELEPPPPQAHRIRLASTAKPNAGYRIIGCSSFLLPVALIVRTAEH